MGNSDRRTSRINRRQFIASVAAGSAVLLARPVAAVAAASKAARKAVKAAAPAATTPSVFDQQRASTLATLQVIRKHPLPPGGELAAVFHPVRPRRKGK